MAENNTPNNTNSSDEIDLGQLFQLIGKGFNSVFRSFLRVFLYLKKNALILLGLIVLGIAIGFGLNQILSKKMKTEVIVKPNLDSRNYLYEVVDEIQSNIKAKDTLFFMDLGIDIENLDGFEVTVESLGDTRKNNEQGTEYLELLKGFEGSSEAISDIVRAEILSKSTLINHKITFYFKDPILGQEYAKKLMAYINSNEYFRELINVYIGNAQERIKQNTNLVEQIDGLITSYGDKLASKDNNSVAQGTISFDTEEKIDLKGLFDLKNGLIRDIESKKVELKNMTEAVRVINFGKPQQVQKPLFGKNIILIPFILIGLFFLISFIRFLNKKVGELI
ncbi:hypothetical protein R3X28_01835 [Maribacter sp. TH_r10]|uniref:hypothetical protein n=1 Tax=Maribacter sp. TH_r10 TaxID=3082086 RepID=UPI0029555AE0|nr:hypothetical protein [Maribacter sp. TH_r10]MDV7137594.1 hypothetical protein [Maribacter sp. TH_r10]